jgi:predicted membrane protein
MKEVLDFVWNLFKRILFIIVNPFKYGLQGSTEEVMGLYKKTFEFLHEISKIISLLGSIGLAIYVYDADKTIKLMKVETPILFWIIAAVSVMIVWRLVYIIYCFIIGSFIVNIYISESLDKIVEHLEMDKSK